MGDFDPKREAEALVRAEPDDGAWVLRIGDARVSERIDFAEEVRDEADFVRGPIAAALAEAYRQGEADGLARAAGQCLAAKGQVEREGTVVKPHHLLAQMAGVLLDLAEKAQVSRG